jgi:ribonucleoside-diphosphate reductase beta chain
MEKMLIENDSKYTVFPIDPEYLDIWELYKKSIKNIWTVEEVDFTQDNSDFQKLNTSEQNFIKRILAFFAASDGIVNENLVLNFYNEIQISEVRQLYATQIFIEAIHNECYSLLIDTLIRDSQEKSDLFQAVSTDPSISRKAEWAKKWITNGTFAQRLIAFLVVEGIFFSASFCAIFWIKNKSILPGLCKSNEWISRDEGLHASTAVMIYNKLENKLPEEQIQTILNEAIQLELEFVDSILPKDLLGMKAKSMKEYVKFIGDFWLTQLNCKKLYGVGNPFHFMDKLNLEIKANFFDVKESNYQGSMQRSQFNLSDEF